MWIFLYYDYILFKIHLLNQEQLLQVYTYEGKFVGCIESSGSKLNDPRGLAVSSDGHVYVADQKNHCIKKYRYISSEAQRRYLPPDAIHTDLSSAKGGANYFA